MSHAESSSTASTSTPSPEDKDKDDWASVQDPNERRRIQNRIAQRKFREKSRLQQESSARAAENQRLASGSYTAAEPEDLDAHDELSGTPAGSFNIRYMMAAGKAKEQSSRETSLYAAKSKAGGSSRLGLHLVDQYARGNPAWARWRTKVAAEAEMMRRRQRQQQQQQQQQ